MEEVRLDERLGQSSGGRPDAMLSCLAGAAQ